MHGPDLSENHRILGMTKFQMIFVILLAALACGVIMLAGAVMLNRTHLDEEYIGHSLFSNPSSSIYGKWDKYFAPTPTPTQGSTPTPIEYTDLFGNIYYTTSVPPITFNITCDLAYPLNLEFFEDNTYVGNSEVNLLSGVVVWQGGEYQIIERDRIKMQTKSGFSVYQFTIDGNHLIFHDDGECEIVYEREN